MRKYLALVSLATYSASAQTYSFVPEDWNSNDFWSD